jgi:hypothetical protein
MFVGCLTVSGKVCSPDDDLVAGNLLSTEGHTAEERERILDNSLELLSSDEAATLLNEYRCAVRAAPSNRYCYLTVLDRDAACFMAKLADLLCTNCRDEQTRTAIVTGGYIKMITWRRVLQMISLQRTYKLWRHLYWGEKADREPSTSTTGFHVLVETFPGPEGSSEVDVLHEKGHLRVLNPLRIHAANGYPSVLDGFWSDNVR